MRAMNKIHRVLDISILDVLKYLNEKLSSRGNTPISHVQKVLLEEMRQNTRNSSAPFNPSIHWEKVNNIFDRYFSTVGINNPEDKEFNLRFSGYASNDKRLHQYVCWLYLNTLKKRDTLHLLEKLSATCKEGAGHGYKMGDKYVSLDLLFSIDDFYNMYELNPSIALFSLTIGSVADNPVSLPSWDSNPFSPITKSSVFSNEENTD